MDPMKQDFKIMLYALWKHLDLPDPTETQYEMADILQHGPDQLVIEAFRGIGKSWVTAAFVIWLLYCNPQLNILVISASQPRADAFSVFVKRLIQEIPWLSHLRPRPGQRDSNINFDVGPAKAAQAPSVKSSGIFGQITGSRADVIIADDIEVPNNSETPAMREKLAERTKEFSAILKPEGTPREIWLGTPQTEQSIYNELPGRGYEMWICPAQFPTEEKMGVYGDTLASFIRDKWTPEMVDKPVCTRFDEETLQRRFITYGRAGYALQFMLDTSLSDEEKYPLKLRDLIVMDLDIKEAPVKVTYGSDPRLRYADDMLPMVGFRGDGFYAPQGMDKERLPYMSKVMAIDPSGRGGDETAYCVIGYLNGFLYLLEWDACEGGYGEDVLTHLATEAKKYAVNKIVVEPNFGDGMFNELLKPVLARIYPCTVEDTERSVAQKEVRIIDSLEPAMMQHRLIVNKPIIDRDYQQAMKHTPEKQNRYRGFYQMTRITRERGCLMKDDRIDVLGMGVHYWTEYMKADADRMNTDRRQKALEAELNKWVKGVTGVDVGGRQADSMLRQRFPLSTR